MCTHVCNLVPLQPQRKKVSLLKVALTYCVSFLIIQYAGAPTTSNAPSNKDYNDNIRLTLSHETVNHVLGISKRVHAYKNRRQP